MPPKSKRASNLEYVFDDITVECTNQDRVMFPADGITKAEVIGHYHRCAELMLPELRGRPLSVERFTKGIDTSGFFQKHYQKHYPDWLASATVGIRTEVTYPVVDNAAGLVYMANQGSIAMHIWTSRADRPERPDLFVVDLDPPEGKFDVVRQTAFELRALFEQIGLAPYVKTTGGKGLHVVAPLDGTAEYDVAMALGHRIAKRLCAEHPDLVTIEFHKKDRKGRLYLDMMRNALGATIVAPYSLRPRPGAPVSIPLDWEELEEPGMIGNTVKLRDMAVRLESIGDPWAGMRDHEASAEAAIDALDALD